MAIFKILKFDREKETKIAVEKSEWHFFVPGVNSGAYDGTLHINVRHQNLTAGIFSFKKNTFYTDINLKRDEFDDLYKEMTKIKELRDNKIINS